MARFESDPTSGGTVEEQTQEEDDTADDQTVNELKPDADGDPMREQTETVEPDTTSSTSTNGTSGGHVAAPDTNSTDSASTSSSGGGSQSASQQSTADTTAPSQDASAPSPDTGGHAKAPEPPEDDSESGSAEQTTTTTGDTSSEPVGDASAPSPDTGGHAKAPEAPPEPTDTTSDEDASGTERRSDVRREQSATPTSGGVAGQPGSGITVEPETRGQIEETKQRVAAQHDDLDAEDLRVTGDRDGRVSFELTEEAREERFNDLVEGREGAVRAVEEQYQRQPDFMEFKQSGKSTPGGNVVPGPQEGMESRASDPGSPRAALRGGRVLAAERDLENTAWTATVPDWVPGVGGTELFTLRGSGGDYEPVRDGNRIRFEQQDPNDIDYSLGLGDPQRDEVEDFLEANIESQRAGAQKIGDAIFGAEGETTPGSESLGEEVLRAAGRPDLGRAYETQLEAVGRGTLDLGPTLTGLAVDTATEGPEFLQSAATQPVETAQKVPGQAAGTGAQTLNYAGDNPGRFTGQLASSLVGTSAAFRATRGTRLSTPTRYLLQPGEEIAGAAGYRATRAAAGERRAEQFFPNKEPLIFSEEAAVRAARRAKGRAENAVSRVPEFVRSERAQANTGRLLGRTETETETETEEDDLGVPRDDPFRQSDKRLYDPAREFDDADDPSRFIDETRRGAPESQRDIGEGIAGRGNPQTATGETSFEENFNRAIRERQRRAQRPEARVTETRRAGVEEDTDLFSSRVSNAVFGREAATRPDVESMQLLEAAERPQARTDSLLDLGVEPRTDSRTRSGLETGLESRSALDRAFESESAFEFETETRSVSEIGIETETETARESETELEFELESETRRELDSDIDPFGEPRSGGRSPLRGERRTKTRRLIDPLTGR